MEEEKEGREVPPLAPHDPIRKTPSKKTGTIVKSISHASLRQKQREGERESGEQVCL